MCGCTCGTTRTNTKVCIVYERSGTRSSTSVYHPEQQAWSPIVIACNLSLDGFVMLAGERHRRDHNEKETCGKEGVSAGSNGKRARGLVVVNELTDCPASA